jgi:intracellular multiplication protein IcmL
MGEVKMADEGLHVIRIRNDFYRDGFGRLVLALSVIVVALIFLIMASIYIYVATPVPVNFATDAEWRILPPVPINKPYLSTANLLQWVSESFSTMFNFDFLNYENKHAEYEHYFTENGWKKYNDLLNMYIPIGSIQNSKSVVTGVADGAPFVVNQGLLSGRYAWWVQMPINVRFSGYNRNYLQSFVLQALVVRVPTLNNLSGVAIDNLVIVSQKLNSTGMLGT